MYVPNLRIHVSAIFGHEKLNEEKEVIVRNLSGFYRRVCTPSTRIYFLPHLLEYAQVLHVILTV